jgi:hypothetical protein
MGGPKRDWSNQQVGELLVFGEAVPPRQEPSKHKYAWWHCACLLCGGHVLARSVHLRGHANPCPCKKHVRNNYRDWTGERVNMLFVIRRNDDVCRHGIVYWECLCDCGIVTNVRSQALANGQLSCGCRSRELTRARALEKLKG